jgi:hypothetical protein
MMSDLLRLIGIVLRKHVEPRVPRIRLRKSEYRRGSIRLNRRDNKFAGDAEGAKEFETAGAFLQEAGLGVTRGRRDELDVLAFGIAVPQ